MAQIEYLPIPIFDTLEEVLKQYKNIYAADNPNVVITEWLDNCFAHSKIKQPGFATNDYKLILNFLFSYRGSQDTFNAYRRDLERILQWSWFIARQSLLAHKREDIEQFIEFCINPDKSWIGLKTVARFKNIDNMRQPNSEWRPFDVYVSKNLRKENVTPNKNDYQFSQQALKVLFATLSSFYNYLLQEESVSVNPVALIRQKSKFLRNEQQIKTIRRLSEEQWQTVIQIAKDKAKEDFKHERAVFILSCLYSMYLRISELVENDRWSPSMSDFFKDTDDNWWFRTIGKGNKARQIAVSNAMLAALIHYRTSYLNIPPYPLPNERLPLISHLKNIHAPIQSERPIRKLVQEYFDLAADHLEKQSKIHDANALRTATVHWLRHTGISDDVKHRPREHVRDDAGHSSGAITDRYIDVDLIERAKSAKHKVLIKDDPN